MIKERIAWHPGFCAAMELALRENEEDLIYEREHLLGQEPLRMDLLIIKKRQNVKMQNLIAHLFKEHNILEYKSPDDNLTIDDFYKTLAYAGLYKSSGNTVNEIPAAKVTISLVCFAYPRKLIKLLQEEKYCIHQQYPGVYYITGMVPFATQIIVCRQLNQKENLWLNSLQKNIKMTEFENLSNALNHPLKRGEADNLNAVFSVIARANKEEFRKWKEETEMMFMDREFLEGFLNRLEMDTKRDMAELFKEEKAKARKRGMEAGIKEGMKKGMKEGMKEGIKKGEIQAFMKLNMSVPEIARYTELSEAQITMLIKQIEQEQGKPA